MKVASKVERTCRWNEVFYNADLYIGAGLASLGVLLAGIAMIRGMLIR